MTALCKSVLLLVLMLSGAYTWACSLTEIETPLGTRWRSDCLLQDLSPELTGQLTLTDRDIGSVLNLADLNPSNLRFRLQDDEVDVFVTVENNGTVATTKPFQVVGSALIFDINDQADPNDDVMVSSAPITLMATAPRLILAHNEDDFYLDTINLPDRTRDYRIQILIAVDPATGANWFGEIFESNESNNGREENHIVYRR